MSLPYEELEGTCVVSAVSLRDDGTFATIKFKPGTHLVEGQQLVFLKPKEEEDTKPIAETRKLTSSLHDLHLSEKRGFNDEDPIIKRKMRKKRERLEYEKIRESYIKPKPCDSYTLKANLDSTVVKVPIKEIGSKVAAGDLLISYRSKGALPLDESYVKCCPFDVFHTHAPTSCTIVEVFVKDGQEVKAGQPFLTYRPDPFTPNYDSDLDGYIDSDFEGDLKEVWPSSSFSFPLLSD